MCQGNSEVLRKRSVFRKPNGLGNPTPTCSINDFDRQQMCDFTGWGTQPLRVQLTIRSPHPVYGNRQTKRVGEPNPYVFK